MNAAFSWGGRFKGRPGLAFTMPVCDDELRKSMLEDGTSLVRLVPLPPVLGAFLWAGQSSQLVKGATHKYIRKVPDGKGGWRYFYAVTGGKGLGHEDEVQVGSAFKLAHNGQAGHFHVTGRDANGKLTVKHDESGHTETLDPAVFVAMLHREHASALDEHTKRLAASLKAAREHGTARHVSRLEGEAGRYGHTRHLVEPKAAPFSERDAALKRAAEHEKAAAGHAQDASKNTGGPSHHAQLAHGAAAKAWREATDHTGKLNPKAKAKAEKLTASAGEADRKAAEALEARAKLKAKFAARAAADEAARPAAEALATARGHLEDARAKSAAGDKAGAQAEMKAAEAHAALVRAHKEGGDTEKAAKAAEAATQAAGGPPEHKRAVPDQVTGDEQRQREEAARKSADKRRGTGKPDQGAPVAAGDVKVGERVVDGKGRTWERTSTAWRGVKPDGSPTGDVQTDKGIGRETLRRAMHNDGDRAVAVDAIHRAAGEAHARGDIEERNRLQDEAANLMPSTASGQPIPPADATPEERQAHAADFGARDHADAATHHAQAARAAEAAGNEQAADQHQAAADEHRQAAVEAIQQGQIHGPNTLALEDGKALPPHDAPKAAWDKATAGFSAADHDEAAALHRAKAFEAAGYDAATFDKSKIDQHRVAAARHAQAAEAMTTQPGSDRSASHTKLEPHERDMLRDFVENTVSHRLADLQQGLKEEQRFGGMSIYRTKNGRTFAAPTDANAHQIVQAWMKEMLHEAMPTMPDDIAEKHGFPEDDRPGVTAGMERVLARALRERATSAVVGKVQRLNNEALAALPPAKGSNGWKAMIERATQQQAGMTAGREARGAKAEKYIDGLTSKAEKAYALAVGIAIMHGGEIKLPRGKAGQPAADLPHDVKMRLRREIAQAMGHSGQGAVPVEIAETRTDAPMPKSLHQAAREGLAPPVEATAGARRAQEAATQVQAAAPAGDDDAAHVKAKAEQAKTRHEDMHEAHVEAERAARARGDVQAATRHRDAAEGHAVAAYHHGNVAAGHANASTGRAAMESSRANEATTKAGDPKAATAPVATQVTPPAAPDAPAQQAASAGAVAEPPSHRYTPPDGKFGTATIKADKHPVTGADTHVVTLGHRLGDQHFPVASARARELGGAYVRRVGFSFPERSAAERFAAEHQHPAQQQQPPEGMPKSRRDLAEEHTAAAKRHNAESLKAMEAGNKDLSKLHASAALAHSRAENAARTGRPDIMDHVEAAHAATKATQEAAGKPQPKEAPKVPTAPIGPTEGEATAGNIHKYQSALKAAYEYAIAVSKGDHDPHEAGALRSKAASMIQDFEGGKSRLDYKNRPRHEQQAGALKKYLSRLDEYAHALADEKHGKDGHDAEAFEKFAQGQGSRGVLESAVSGAISKSGKVLDLPGHVRQHVGNVPLEAGVKALVEATKRSGYDMAAGPKRVAHALGETGTKLSTNLHDMPLEVVQKLATGAPDSQGRYTMGDANNELAARHATASALGVPVEQVQPKHGVGTSKQALTEGIEALRDKAGSGDHRLTGDAYTELSRRDRISQAMGHGPLDELAEGGKADPVWSAPVVEHADGRRFLKRDGKWHEVGQDGRVAQFGRSRGEIEKAGRGQFRAATSSPDDMHNMTVSAMLDKIRYSGRKGASSPDWDVARELRAAVAHHNGGADGKPIKSGTGELPFEHVARAAAMYDAHMADGNKLNLHEAMTDAQLKQVVGAGADHNDTHKNELEARRLGNAPLEPEKKSTTPKGGEKAVNYEQVGSMLVAKHPNGWGVWQDNGKPTEIIAGTRNEALHAAADLHERTKAGGAGGFEAARDEVKQRLENGIHARAAAVRAGRSAAGNTQAAVDALHALHAAAPKGVRTAVGDAKGNKTTKVLTPDQARRRLGTFASQEESRPNLNGYYVDPKTNTGIATDGHRLAMIPVQGHDVQGEGKTEGAIYRHQDPKGHAQSREKYAAMHEPERRDAARETWDRSYGAGSKVEVMDTQPGPTQGKQVPAAFPDYTSVIPRSGTTDYLDTDHVRQALDHADTLMRGTGTGAVTIERKNGEVLLTAHNRDSAHGPVTVKLGDTQHPDGKVAVKASYLRDTLTGAKGGTFGLTTNESLSPMLVERHDGERHVVMPMRL